MSDYAIGDVQGCFTQLMNLLDAINYDETNDRLWFVGDLVNRGPESLSVLRFVQRLKVQPVITLGNHDLHFLACAYGIKSPTLKPVSGLEQDSLDELLQAPDCRILSHWLRQQALIHYSKELNVVMSHAGIPPAWNLTTALQLANEAQNLLCDGDYIHFFNHMYGNEPAYWQESLSGMDRMRFIINALTRMRFCNEDGGLNLMYKGGVKNAPDSIIPWFNVTTRMTIKPDIVFGHWAALAGCTNTPSVYAIDTGCLWGGYLSALRLQDKKLFQVSGLNVR